MRNWSKRTWRSVISVTLLAGAAIFWGTRPGLRGGPWLEVQFLGYTNPANYSRGLALFMISNRTDRTVTFDALPEF